MKYLKFFENIDYEKDFDWEEEDPNEPVKIKNVSELKIGDRVICYGVGSVDTAKGTVIYILYDDQWPGVSVEFDEYIDGHDCNQKGKDGYCWNVLIDSNNIRKI